MPPTTCGAAARARGAVGGWPAGAPRCRPPPGGEAGQGRTVRCCKLGAWPWPVRGWRAARPTRRCALPRRGARAQAARAAHASAAAPAYQRQPALPSPRTSMIMNTKASPSASISLRWICGRRGHGAAVGPRAAGARAAGSRSTAAAGGKPLAHPGLTRLCATLSSSVAPPASWQMLTLRGKVAASGAGKAGMCRQTASSRAAVIFSSSGGGGSGRAQTHAGGS